MMKKWFLTGLFFLSGCTTAATTFKCDEAPCPSYHKTSNLCLAQADASYTDHNYREFIFGQCMAGQGYREYECNPQLIYEYPCQSSFVFD